jgi:hypothetical protein
VDPDRQRCCGDQKIGIQFWVSLLNLVVGEDILDGQIAHALVDADVPAPTCVLFIDAALKIEAAACLRLLII